MWTEATPTGDVIVCAFGVDEIARLAEAEGNYFFSRDTMRWFGTRNLDMVDARVMIGLDTKAPEDTPRYWARVFTAPKSLGGQYFGAEMIGRYATRREAIRAAHDYAREIKAHN